MKKLKKYYKIILVFLIVSIIILLGYLVFKNLFYSEESNRLEGIEEYVVTSDEIEKVKEKLNEIENIDVVDIYTNYKIIKISIELNEDIDFEDIKKISNEALINFKEENLGYYDVEIFVNSKDENSDIYPKIGYKHKTNLEFTWNR